MDTYLISFFTISSILFIAKESNTSIKISGVSLSSQKIACVVSFLLLTTITGLRYYVGTDYAQYTYNYKIYKNYNFDSFYQIGSSLVGLLSRFIYDDYVTWFFIMAILGILPICWAINKYSISISYSTLLYSFVYWPMTFNIVKQSVSAAIILAFGYKYLLEFKFKKWLIVCILASCFHISAVLLIPLYFLFTNRNIKKNIYLMTILSIIMFFSFDFLFSIMGYLKGVELSYVNSKNAYIYNSVNPIRVLVKCLPVLLVYIIKQNINLNDKKIYILINIALLNFFTSVAFFNSIYMQRFTIYFDIFTIIFLPYLFNSMNRINKIIIIPVVVIIYFTFGIYDLYKGDTTQIYQTIFSR